MVKDFKNSEWGTPQKYGLLTIRYKPTGELIKLELGIKRMHYNNELVFCDCWGYDGGKPTDKNHPDNYEVVELEVKEE